MKTPQTCESSDEFSQHALRLIQAANASSTPVDHPEQIAISREAIGVEQLRDLITQALTIRKQDRPTEVLLYIEEGKIEASARAFDPERCNRKKVVIYNSPNQAPSQAVISGNCDSTEAVTNGSKTNIGEISGPLSTIEQATVGTGIENFKPEDFLEPILEALGKVTHHSRRKIRLLLQLIGDEVRVAVHGPGIINNEGELYYDANHNQGSQRRMPDWPSSDQAQDTRGVNRHTVRAVVAGRPHELRYELRLPYQKMDR